MTTCWEDDVFDIECSACGRRHLLPPSHVRALINDDQGIAVIYQCFCGEMGALRTGAAYEQRLRDLVG